MSIIHRHFNSSASYAKWVESQGIGTDRNLRYYSGRDDGDSMALAKHGVKLLRTGDTTHIPEARKLLREFTEKLESPHFVWENSIQGAFPDVPMYLAGDPENMWRSANKPDDTTPLKIFVGLGCSWQISPEQLRKRGIVLAAFAMALAEVRPIYITPFCNGHSYESDRVGGGPTDHGIITFDLSTSPLVLSQLMACMSDVSIVRHIWIPAMYNLQPRVGGGIPFRDIKREQIPGIRSEDVYIPPITNSDPLLNQPLIWLKQNIKKYGQVQND